MSIVTAGQTISISVQVDSNGSPSVPSSIALTVTDPLSNQITYTTSTTPTLVNPSAGSYYLELTPTAIGTWSYEWVANGSTLTESGGSFIVVASIAAAPTSKAPPIDHSDVYDCLVGLDPWFSQSSSVIAGYNSQKINSLIPQWIRRFEREVQFRINPVQCVTGGPQNDGVYAPVGAQTGVTMDVTGNYEVVVESGYTYIAGEALEFMRCQLRERPVQNLQRVRIMLGQTIVYQFPDDWIFIDPRSGLFQIVPVVGAASVINAAVALYAVQISFGQRGYIPFALCFDYIAGLPYGWQNTAEYGDYRRILSEYCAMKVLEDICHAYDPGLTNKSVNSSGENASFMYDRFMQRKAELKASVDAFKDELKGQETPILFGAV